MLVLRVKQLSSQTEKKVEKSFSSQAHNSPKLSIRRKSTKQKKVARPPSHGIKFAGARRTEERMSDEKER